MRKMRSAVRVVQEAERREERRDVPRVRRPRGEDGDLPVHREGNLARGRLLLRERAAPFPIRVSVISCPAVAEPSHGTGGGLPGQGGTFLVQPRAEGRSALPLREGASSHFLL